MKTKFILFGYFIQLVESSCTEMKTTVEQSLTLLGFLKCAGAFPFLLVYKSVGKVSFERIELDISLKYKIYQIVVGFYIFLRQSVGTFQLIRSFCWDHPQKWPYHFNALCLVILFDYFYLIWILFNWHCQKVVKLYNDWHAVEVRILRHMCSKATDDGNWPQDLNLDLPCRIVRNNLLLTLTSNAVLATWAALRTPRYAMFLYTLVDPAVESTWFKVISVMEINLAFALRWIHFTHFEIFLTAFPRSIANCLKILRQELRSPGNEFFTCYMNAEPSSALCFYRNLDRLVFDFNTIYGYCLFGLKFVFLVIFCIVFYIPIRQPQLINAVSVAFFASITISTLKRVAEILNGMGNVRREAEKFKQEWARELSQFYRFDGDGIRQSLTAFDVANTIAFRGGRFYDIQPGALLTFLSIATTYVIVALQF